METTNRRKMTGLMLAAGLWTLAPGRPALAQDAATIRLQLDEQQAKLNQRFGRIDVVANAHGRYVLVRDTYLYGPDGVSEQGQAWLQKAHVWVGEWQKLLAFFAETTPANLNRVDVQNGIRDALRQQLDAWTALKQQAAAVTDRSAYGRAELAKIERLPDSFVEHYAAQIRTLNDQIDALDAALAKASAGFAADQHQVWEQLVDETQAAVLNKLKRAMLQYPELQSALAQAEAYFAAERTLGPVVRDVQTKFAGLRDEVLQKRLFHATDALAALRSAATAAKATIDASGVDAGFANPAREQVNAALAAGEQLFAEATRSFTHGALVAAYKTSASRTLAAGCRDMSVRKTLDCDLLRTLLPVPPEEIVKMSDDQLRYLEFAFAKVSAGPLH